MQPTITFPPFFIVYYLNRYLLLLFFLPQQLVSLLITSFNHFLLTMIQLRSWCCLSKLICGLKSVCVHYFFSSVLFPDSLASKSNVHRRAPQCSHHRHSQMHFQCSAFRVLLTELFPPLSLTGLKRFCFHWFLFLVLISVVWRWFVCELQREKI